MATPLSSSDFFTAPDNCPKQPAANESNGLARVEMAAATPHPATSQVRIYL
jgi:hypothetical protein